jgi:hypothetical protein
MLRPRPSGWTGAKTGATIAEIDVPIGVPVAKIDVTTGAPTAKIDATTAAAPLGRVLPAKGPSSLRCA